MSLKCNSNTYFSQRLRLHYAEWGNPGAPAVVLLHGIRDHCRNWDWVAEHLQRDFHLIAPDLRGHGDSEWAKDGNYPMAAYVYDLAQLIHQADLAPVTIIGHSLGGNIGLRYAGLYPQHVARIVAIEGLGLSPALTAERTRTPIDERLRTWIDEKIRLSGRMPRRYPTLEDAYARMRQENAHLSEAQARHLTLYGAMQNEDGSFSWKFDNYVRAVFPSDVSTEELQGLWSRISCPTLLVYGADSWASNPATDGRIAHFQQATVSLYEKAGHWVHHDRLDAFVVELENFLRLSRACDGLAVDAPTPPTGTEGSSVK